MRWIGYVAAILWWSGIARSLSSMNRGYKISPKPCRVPGQSRSIEGTCMFVWECIKSEGTHVGVCVDTFMFGSCCVHNATSNSIASTGAVSSSSSSGNSAARPSLAEALAVSETTTTTTTTTTHGSAGPVSTSHFAASHAGSQAHTSLATTKQPARPSSLQMASRPLQKRPHSKPHGNSSPNDSDYPEHHQQQSQKLNVSLQVTRNRPQNSLSSSYLEKRPEEDRHHGSSGGNSHHHLHHHHHHHHQNFKDKVSSSGSSHNTLLVRLPNKTGQQASASKNQRPYNQRPRPYPEDEDEVEEEETVDSIKTDEQTQDLSVQESIHRPSINSVDDDEASDKLGNPNLNFIHTERPQWATKPLSSNNRPEYSKPYFSVKTTSTSPTTTGATHRPHSSLKPETTRPTTMVSASYYSSQSTSAAGSVPQTAHWQVTTEPAFVTRYKPPSSVSVSSSLRPEGSWPPKPPPPPPAPPASTQHKPQWLADSQRPSFKPTETQENNNVYQKPHSAHYITTSYLETPTKARPSKKPTTPSPSTASTSLTTSSTTTSTSTSTSTTTTTTTTTTQRPTASSIATSSQPESSTEARTGSVLTIPAASENSDMSCGVPALFSKMPETRIVGGKEAAFGKWPWQVSVRRTSFFGFSSTHRCGGAVLNENWIATAGHCVDDLLTSQIRIRVGEYDFSSVQERLPYVERGITKKVVHPKYNFFTFEYDLALVRLETPLSFAAHISPICLPASDELLIGENATVTGWGRLSEGGTLPSVLQEVSVPIVSNDRCKSMFLRAGRHEFIPEIFLCAGYENGGQDSCQGDSGGPLQVRGKDGRYFLAGIISWGIGCAEANLPGVCTRISKFVPWILKNVT